MSTIILKTSEEIAKDIAVNFKKMRKRKGITQRRMAVISGVSYASIRRFETTGEISFVSLIDMCTAIHETEWLEDLFKRKVYRSIDEVINEK